jgi:cell division protein FtsI (penicillin-binding protein 3)
LPLNPDRPVNRARARAAVHRRRAASAPPPRAATRLTSRRALAMLVVTSLGLTAIVLRLTQVQAVSAAEYAQKGTSQRLRKITLAAERGAIFDRRGTDLALSVSQQTVWANPRVVADPAGYAAKLAPILRADEKALATRLANRKQAFVYLARKVDDATAEAVRKLGLAGVDFVPESKRFYPSGTLAAPLLGSVGIDNEGLAGLEVAYDQKLAGHPGELVVEQDPEGRQIPQGYSRLNPAVRGQDLILTLDQSLQFEVERALADAVTAATAKGGLAVVADTRTGAVLAMANVTGDGAGAARPATATERNKAVTDVYEPGSTNKVITMAGALEEGLVTPESRLVVPDKLAMANATFSDHEPHPPTDWSVTDILVNSSNVGTIMVAQKLGKDRLDRYLRQFGFGTATGVGFPGEPNGLLLDPDHWYVTSMGTVPIGNGLAVSALQMLDVYMVVANGGIFRPPTLLEATVDAQGVRHPIPPKPTHRVISPETAAKLNAMLSQVVRTGTGTNATIPGYTAAGKTGTARKPLEGARGYSGNYVASFVGYVPAEDPRLAAVVVLDEPTPIYGGQVAAPVFSRVMQYALRLERIPPPPPPPPGQRQTGVPPGQTPVHALDEAPAPDGTTVTSGPPAPPTPPATARKPAATTATTARKPAAPTTPTTARKPAARTTTTARKPTATTTTTTTRKSSAATTTSSSSTTTTTTAPGRSPGGGTLSSRDRRSGKAPAGTPTTR